MTLGDLITEHHATVGIAEGIIRLLGAADKVSRERCLEFATCLFGRAWRRGDVCRVGESEYAIVNGVPQIV